jgi:hypothetical protein
MERLPTAPGRASLFISALRIEVFDAGETQRLIAGLILLNPNAAHDNRHLASGQRPVPP